MKIKFVFAIILRVHCYSRLLKLRVPCLIFSHPVLLRNCCPAALSVALTGSLGIVGMTGTMGFKGKTAPLNVGFSDIHQESRSSGHGNIGS